MKRNILLFTFAALALSVQAQSYLNCPDSNHPHMIDLGLPSGTLWACCNVGASNPEDYGSYFSWGETSVKECYDYPHHLYGGYDNIPISYLGEDIAGSEYDAATVNWGTPWRMASKEQYEELLNYTTPERIHENSDCDGWKFTGSNGGVIFIPAAGYRNGNDLALSHECCMYWASTFSHFDMDGNYDTWKHNKYAYFLNLSIYDNLPDSIYVNYRYAGLSIRPVRRGPNITTDYITRDDVDVDSGNNTFSIGLTNTHTDYVSFQMDLTLPEGVSINKNECSLTSRFTDSNQQLTIGKQDENTYRLTSTSFSLTPLSGTNGELINISVNVAPTFLEGKTTISNVRFVTANSERFIMNDVTFDIIKPINFADETVKAICIANWDANGDGELSYSEAAGVTDLNSVFRGKNITSFDELQYFIGLTKFNSSEFWGCSKLASISIPNSVTSIGTYAFDGCKSLTSINIPNSVVSIGHSVLRDCAALSYISVEEGNSKYNSNGNCNAIIETESGRLIAGCKNTIIPNSVSIIEQDAFYGNHGLTSFIIPNSVTSINLSAFEGCDHLVSIVIPSSVNQLGDRILIRCESLKAVKLNISDPITINDDFISNEYNTTLYVPKNSKAAYMAANHWKDITNIKEFPDADVNQDGEVDVVDVVDVARFVVGTPSEKFEEFLADLNIDDEVNVVDAVVLVVIVAGETNFSRPAATESNSDDIYLLYTENDKNHLSLQLNGNGKYTALQFDLLLPNGIDVKDMQMNSLRLQDHQLLFNEISDGLYRVIAISTSNSTFNANEGELINIELEGDATNDIMVDQIHFVTPQAVDMIFDAINASKGSIPDGINTLQISDNKKVIYNLNGQKLERLQKGVNIIGTKKVVVR